MYCFKCGKELEGTPPFCVYCGMSLRKKISQQVNVESQSAPQKNTVPALSETVEEVPVAPQQNVRISSPAPQMGRMPVPQNVCAPAPQNERFNVPRSVGTPMDDEPIDLRGCVSSTQHQEKKYKPLLWAGLITIPILITMYFLGLLFYSFVIESEGPVVRNDNFMYVGMSIVSLPYILFSIFFLLHARKKHLRSGSQRKMEKGTAPLFYVIATLTAASAMVFGFSDGFSSTGLMSLFTMLLFALMSILLVVYCNAVSHQNGTEAYLCFARALLVAALLAAPVGFVMGAILRALEFLLFILIIFIVLFFIGGGGMIIVWVRNR